MKIKNKGATHRTLLRDLAEITEVLGVEARLMRALLAMAIMRRALYTESVFAGRK